MLEVIPAVIPRDLDELEMHLERVRGFVPAVQVDVLDGEFVKGVLSWPFNEGKARDELATFARGDTDLPLNDEFLFEVDLMIAEPERSIEDFICAGFSRVIPHIEAAEDMGACIEIARNMDAEIGIAINIDTPNAALEEWIERVDFVQCMGIAKIGAQGQPFDGRVVEKIEAIKRAHSDILVSVDGGVSPKTAPFLLSAGAERLVSGSAIFGSTEQGLALRSEAGKGEALRSAEDIDKTLREFYALVEAPEEGRYET